MSLSIKSSEYRKPILCQNPLGMHEHWILPTGRKMEEYGYCAVCSSQAFRDNISSPNPESIAKHAPYDDSKINNRNFVQCESDSL